MDRLYILGAGGSGKTTLAAAVAGALGVEPIELDRDPFRDRAALAAADRWVVEGIFLFDIEALLNRADVILWLDLPRRIAQRRIVTRHFWLSARRRNRYRGLRKLISFVKAMATYYERAAREPVAANDWDALSRALTEERLAPYMHKVRHLTTPREVRAFRRGVVKPR